MDSIESLSRYYSQASIFAFIRVRSVPSIVKRTLLLVGSMASLDTEIVSELASSLERAIRVALLNY